MGTGAVDVEVSEEVWYRRVDMGKVFARQKANLTDGRVSPFTAFDIGVAFPLKREHGRHRGFVEPAIGCDLSVGERNRVSVAVGYHLQEISYYTFHDRLVNDSSYDHAAADVTSVAGLITVRLGFMF